MTEQIERELIAAFHERADRLEIMPPPSASAIRRARVQSALAAAVVVALIGGVTVVGTRLAASGQSSVNPLVKPGLGKASAAKPVVVKPASGALGALQRAIAKTVVGRYHVVMTGSSNDGHRQPTSLVDFDGAAHVAVVQDADGKVDTIWADGKLYQWLSAHGGPPDLAGLPASARWQVEPVAAGSYDVNLDGSDFSGLGVGLQDPTVDRGLVPIVTRTPDGFRAVVTAKVPNQNPSVTTYHLAPDGTILSIHSVVTMYNVENEPTPNPVVLTGDTTFTPLVAPIEYSIPDPSTVVTRAQVSAAVAEYFREHPAPKNGCVTSSPQSAGGYFTVSCGDYFSSGPVPPSSAGTPSPSPSPS